jgi:hypothetical protein
VAVAQPEQKHHRPVRPVRQPVTTGSGEFAAKRSTPRLRARCRLATDVTTTTSYRFNDRASITVPGGVADVEIIETPQHPSWNS